MDKLREENKSNNNDKKSLIIEKLKKFIFYCQIANDYLYQTVRLNNIPVIYKLYIYIFL